MANTHEHTFFDRALVDRAFAMKWAALDKKYRGWGQWSSAQDLLVNWAMDGIDDTEADHILATKTVRATFPSVRRPFGFLWGLSDAKSLCAGGADIPKGEHEYADQITSCAAAGFARGQLSPPQ